MGSVNLFWGTQCWIRKIHPKLYFLSFFQAKILGRLDAVQKATKDYTLEATPDDRASVLQQVSN